MRPGPVERRWLSRLHYRVFGSWPRSVVHERLSRYDSMGCPENVKAIMREVYAQAGKPVPLEYQRLADRGLVCEEHPSLPWPHGDCAGPGMLREDVGS